MYFKLKWAKLRCPLNVSYLGSLKHRSDHFSLLLRALFTKTPKVPRFDVSVSVSTNLYEKDFKLTAFIKKLDVILTSKERDFGECVDFISSTDISLSNNNDQFVELFSSFDDGDLAFMFDVITFINQTKEDENNAFLLRTLSLVLSRRELITTCEGKVDISLFDSVAMCTVRLLNPHRHTKELILHINSQIRKHVDCLLSGGLFTGVIKRTSYILDPRAITTITHILLHKLPLITSSDYKNIPSLLFSTKVYDIRVLLLIISHASENPCKVFGNNDSCFLNFLKGLSLFDDCCRNENKVVKPIELCIKSLNDRVPQHNEDTLYFILSNIVNVNSNYKGYEILVRSILEKIGVLAKNLTSGNEPVSPSKDPGTVLESISDLNFVRFMKYAILSLYQISSKKGWIVVERALVGNFHNDKVYYNDQNTTLISNLAKELSNRISERLTASFGTNDSPLTHLNALQHIILLANRCIILNIEKKHVHQVVRSIRNIIKSMDDKKVDVDELYSLLAMASKMDVRIIAEITRVLLDIALKFTDDENPKAIDVVIKALSLLKLDVMNRFKTGGTFSRGDLLCIASATLLVVNRSKNFLESGKISERAHINHIISIYHLVSDVKYSSADSGINLKLKELIERMRACISDVSENGIFQVEITNKLLKLQKDNKLLLHIDEIMKNGISKNMSHLKLSQLVSVFIYNCVRMYNTESFDLLLIDKLKGRICEMANNLNKTIQLGFSNRCYRSEGDRKKVNPWDNDSELKILFTSPIEPHDIFIREKHPEIDKYMTLGRYSRDEEKGQLTSLYDINRELQKMIQMLMDVRLTMCENSGLDTLEKLSKLIEEACSAISQSILTIAICIPVLRNRNLPKRHTSLLVETSLRKFCNKENGDV